MTVYLEDLEMEDHARECTEEQWMHELGARPSMLLALNPDITTFTVFVIYPFVHRVTTAARLYPTKPSVTGGQD